MNLPDMPTISTYPPGQGFNFGGRRYGADPDASSMTCDQCGQVTRIPGDLSSVAVRELAASHLDMHMGARAKAGDVLGGMQAELEEAPDAETRPAPFVIGRASGHPAGHARTAPTPKPVAVAKPWWVPMWMVDQPRTAVSMTMTVAAVAGATTAWGMWLVAVPLVPMCGWMCACLAWVADKDGDDKVKREPE